MAETATQRAARMDSRTPFPGGPFDLFAEHLKSPFRLADMDALEDLLILVHGYSCRDQEEIDDGTLQRRRAEGHRLAIEMRDNARSMIASLEAIHAAWTRFNAEAVRWHPPLLEAIFDVDTYGPDNLFIPDQIDVLETGFPEGYWEIVEAMIQRFADLPIRPKLKRGPVENVTLRRALAACRAYWRDVEGKSWSMSSLKTASARQANDLMNLQGECELFVTDVLTTCGVRYTLQELSSAWVASDQM